MQVSVNPQVNIADLENAIESGDVKLEPCVTTNDLNVYSDEPEGHVRVTYANIVNNKLKAMATFVEAAPVKQKPCFTINVATQKDQQDNGIGTMVITKSIEEFSHHLQRVGINEFYIQAAVSFDNTAANRLASNVIDENPQTANEEYSGEPCYVYHKLITQPVSRI